MPWPEALGGLAQKPTAALQEIWAEGIPGAVCFHEQLHQRTMESGPGSVSMCGHAKKGFTVPEPSHLCQLPTPGPPALAALRPLHTQVFVSFRNYCECAFSLTPPTESLALSLGKPMDPKGGPIGGFQPGTHTAHTAVTSEHFPLRGSPCTAGHTGS